MQIGKRLLHWIGIGHASAPAVKTAAAEKPHAEFAMSRRGLLGMVLGGAAGTVAASAERLAHTTPARPASEPLPRLDLAPSRLAADASATSGPNADRIAFYNLANHRWPEMKSMLRRIREILVEQNDGLHTIDRAVLVSDWSARAEAVTSLRNGWGVSASASNGGNLVSDNFTQVMYALANQLMIYAVGIDHLLATSGGDPHHAEADHFIRSPYGQYVLEFLTQSPFAAAKNFAERLGKEWRTLDLTYPALNCSQLYKMIVLWNISAQQEQECDALFVRALTGAELATAFRMERSTSEMSSFGSLYFLTNIIGAHLLGRGLPNLVLMEPDPPWTQHVVPGASTIPRRDIMTNWRYEVATAGFLGALAIVSGWYRGEDISYVAPVEYPWGTIKVYLLMRATGTAMLSAPFRGIATRLCEADPNYLFPRTAAEFYLVRELRRCKTPAEAERLARRVAKYVEHRSGRLTRPADWRVVESRLRVMASIDAGTSPYDETPPPDSKVVHLFDRKRRG